MRLTFEMRRGPRALARVSKGDSDIHSSCEMKDKPALKSLHGNPALFRVRASGCPFHLRQQTQVHSLILVAERHLLLWCLWKVDIPIELKPGNHSHLEMILSTWSFPHVAVLNLVFL